MTETGIQQLIARELAAKTMGVVEQFLEVHTVVIRNDAPVIARICRAPEERLTSVYLPVEKEKFYFVFFLDTARKVVEWAQVEPFHSILLEARADTPTAAGLADLTTLTPTSQHDQGAIRFAALRHELSAVRFLPNPEPDTFERKLTNLLDYLEQDAAGIQALAATAEECFIRVVTIFHNGNGMLGGHTLNARSLRRISALGLEVVFDLYAEGKRFT